MTMRAVLAADGRWSFTRAERKVFVTDQEDPVPTPLRRRSVILINRDLMPRPAPL